MELAGEILNDFIDDAAGPSSRLFPIYLLITVCICLFAHRRQKVRSSFLAWLVPKSMYLHPSHIVDLKVFFVTRLATTIGLFNLVTFSAIIAAGMADSLSLGVGIGAFHPMVIAFLLLMVSDFSTYWVHRLHHESRIIWPFHSLHHSAEVMTPVTVYRKHPVYDMISGFVRGVLIGALQGALLVIFEQKPNVITIAGVNVFYVLFNLAGSNLRHSHVWLSFGSFLEHLLISPAQHQIHHSLATRHHNKNYGEVLAIWDCMFGTLYVPREREILEYGLADKGGRRLRQRHDTLTAAMVVPVADSFRQVANIFASRRDPPPAAEDRPDIARARATRSMD